MNLSKVLLGEEIGLLTVLREIQTDVHGTHVLCKCSCKYRSEVVVRLSDARRRAKNKTKVPSCGCLSKNPPRKGRRQIPDRVLQQKVYSMDYEQSRYKEKEIRPKEVRTKPKGISSGGKKLLIRRVGMGAYKTFRKRYHWMMNVCYNKECSSYHMFGARGITVCSEWRDPDQGFLNYMAHFLDSKPPHKRRFIIRRSSAEVNFTPDTCELIVPKKERTKREREKEKKSPKVAELPLLVTLREGTHGISFEASFRSKYLGRYATPNEAVEVLRAWFNENSSMTYDQYVEESTLKSHSLFRRWYLLNQRYSSVIHKPWSRKEFGLQGFRNFLEDMDIKGKYENLTLSRIDKTKPFCPTNTRWVRKKNSE